MPFCGVKLADLNLLPDDAAAAVVGAGHSLGTPHPGAENGPFFVRTLSKQYTWSAEHPSLLDVERRAPPLQRVVDIGDIDFAGASLAGALQAIEGVVAALPPRVAPCVIGGDHTVTYGVVRALLARRLDSFWVVQFDHHLDLALWGSLTGDPEPEPIFHTNVMSHVSRAVGPGRLVQIGMDRYATVEQDSSAAVLEYLERVGKQVCLGSSALREEAALTEIVGSQRDIYVTVDVDVLERREMTSTSYPADVGLRTLELLRLIDVVLAGNRLIGFDVVEFGADRAARDVQTLADSARAAMIFLHLLGWIRKE